MKPKILALHLYFNLEVKCFTYFMFYLALRPYEMKHAKFYIVYYKMWDILHIFCKLGHNLNCVIHKNVLRSIYCRNISRLLLILHQIYH